MQEQSKMGYVYILTNPCFKNDWVKIGFSDNVERRASELQSSGVPLPFEVYAVLKTTKYTQAEKLIHNMIQYLSPEKRVNPQREFFNIPPDDALYMLSDVAKIIDDAEIIIYNENRKAEKATNCDTLKRIDPDEFSIIKCEHILFAATFVDKYGVPEKYNSRTRQVIINDKKYPPKYTISVAYFNASGVADVHIADKIKEQKILNHFNTVATFPIYKKLGFTVETKDDDE